MIEYFLKRLVERFRFSQIAGYYNMDNAWILSVAFIFFIFNVKQIRVV